MIHYKIGYKILTVNQLLDYMIPVAREFGESSITGEELNRYINKLYNLARFIIALDDEEIVGIHAFYDNNTREKIGFLTLIHIKENYRKSGIASKFIEIAENHFKELKFKEINGEIHKLNLKSFNLYQRHGYTISEERESTVIISKKFHYRQHKSKTKSVEHIFPLKTKI